jgi:hypothetical protein
MYGRIVSVHHASPYERLPNDFASDPFLERVSPVWRHRGSVYGPAFVAFAAAGTFVAGDSPLLTRLYFQLSAAALVAAVLAVVWRRTRSPAALVWLGLHPLFGATVVNSGQVDAFVGVAVLTAALLAGKRRAVTAGVVIAVAALTKLTALLGLVGLVLWALWRRDRRSAITMTVAAAGTTALGYLPFLPAATSVLQGADHSVTPGSFWNAPAAWLVGHDAGRALPARLLPDPTLSVLFYVSLALVAVLAVGLGWRVARLGPEPAAGVAAASYTMAAEYTLPWYAAWSLPALAERKPSPVAWVVWVQAAVLLAAWKLPLPPSGSALDTAARSVLVYLAPVVLLVAFIAAGAARPSRA